MMAEPTLQTIAEKRAWLTTMLGHIVLGLSLEQIEIGLLRDESLREGRLPVDEWLKLCDRELAKLQDRAKTLIAKYGSGQIVHWRGDEPCIPGRESDES